MKFKIAVISLLTAIMMICGYTGYRLIQEAEKQTEIQTIQTKMNYITSYKVIIESSDLAGTKKWDLADIEREHRNLIDLVGAEKGTIGTEPYEN